LIALLQDNQLGHELIYNFRERWLIANKKNNRELRQMTVITYKACVIVIQSVLETYYNKCDMEATNCLP